MPEPGTARRNAGDSPPGRQPRAAGKRRAGRETIHELVYQEIRRSLMVGSFAPGDKVSLRNLAQQLGTSLTPVRGAVNRLTAEGAFQVLPNRWVVIPPMTREKFEEITAWRVKLESAAARKACARLTPAGLARIRRLNRQIGASMRKSGDRKDLLVINHDFHFAIYRAAGSKVLLGMIESLWLQEGPFTYYSLLSPRALWNASHHDSIIAALARRDADAAAEAVRRDILTAAEFLSEHGHYEQPRLNRVSGWQAPAR